MAISTGGWLGSHFCPDPHRGLGADWDPVSVTFYLWDKILNTSWEEEGLIRLLFQPKSAGSEAGPHGTWRRRESSQVMGAQRRRAGKSRGGRSPFQATPGVTQLPTAVSSKTIIRSPLETPPVSSRDTAGPEQFPWGNQQTRRDVETEVAPL